MAEYSYIDYRKMPMDTRFSIEELEIIRETMIETGPHSSYSIKHKLVLEIGQMVIKANERILLSAENSLEYDKLSVIEYPKKKDNAA